MLPRLHRGVPGAAPRVRGHGEQRRLACPWQDRAMVPFLMRAAVTGFALWVVTLFVPGMRFAGGDTTLQRVAIIFVVAVIFGLVNAFIKPIVQILSIPLYILTLGLFHVVVNASMLWLTAWITEHTTHWGLQIDHFWWTAIWAAILLSIVSWILSLLARDFRRVTRAH
ncbi:Membrane protein, putative [Mycobacterium tuberculosis variant bovis]|uniref:Membrane protein, putative n=12 Tax=Mycobacterium tuberculosis complex TaxID=77643 RepID=Q7D7T6_MYCTO|nr:membrane protein, putative [Mycobacterium tuberculosis CDC1551]CEJ28708.1 Membrane protein, putative [Mycobacterium tuberculosis variant bovis]CEJ37740.1 Membrane protein, putative [Mycobacterium tuberculosis variant bovis]CEJ41060.1 Membrane protein, putative [Mycobacterium tuberculosis variant bovis]CEJ52261.1 Membrane protein, putative [Mycobacterium tuberculosis variant caprae]